MDDRFEFQRFSELVEDALYNLGSHEILDGDLAPCSGRLLYSVLWYHRQILKCFFDHEEKIILAIGDRTTQVPDGPYPCHGITSHGAALTVIDNIYFEFNNIVLAALELKSAPAWEQLTSSQRAKVAVVETGHEDLRYCWSELANKVKTERLLYFNTLPPLPVQSTCKKSDLREMTGLANDAINEYLRAAKLPIAPRGRGGANFEWRSEQVRALLATIVSSCTDQTIKRRCATALKRFSNPI